MALIACLTIHEFAHAKSAQLAGDDTAKQAGRVSLNPVDHLDPLGTVMMVFMAISGIGIGWAKPVPVNTSRMRNPRVGNILVSIAGPFSNILFALAMGTMVRFLPAPFVIDHRLLLIIVEVNLTLAFFNLIPIPPLDGSHVLAGLLPPELAKSYERFMAQFGMFLLIGIIVAGGGILWSILGPPVDFLYTLFTGGYGWS